jgi:hypothetical protein
MEDWVKLHKGNDTKTWLWRIVWAMEGLEGAFQTKKIPWAMKKGTQSRRTMWLDLRKEQCSGPDHRETQITMLRIKALNWKTQCF